MNVSDKNSVFNICHQHWFSLCHQRNWPNNTAETYARYIRVWNWRVICSKLHGLWTYNDLQKYTVPKNWNFTAYKPAINCRNCGNGCWSGLKTNWSVDVMTVYFLKRTVYITTIKVVSTITYTIDFTWKFTPKTVCFSDK